MSPEFKCERTIDLPASPDKVWQAVATTDGLAAWLFPMPIPPIGDGTTIWNPPHHLAIRMQQGDWFNALDYTIDSQNGSSRLRYVHSGIFVDDWDTQFDAVQQHTDFYLHTLGQFLEFFNGRPVTFVGDIPGGIQGPASSASPEAFEKLKQALGIGPDVAVGSEVHLAPHGVANVDGVVDYLTANFLGIRTPSSLVRFFGRNAFGQPVGMSIHAFDAAVDGAAAASSWHEWLERTFG